MVHPNPGLSLTLPRNFVYHLPDGDAPKTPEQERPEITEAPALNRNMHSARPALAAREVFHQDGVFMNSSNVAVPTIEIDNAGPSGLMNLFRQPAASSSNSEAIETVRRFILAPSTPTAERSLLDSALHGNDVFSTHQEPVPEGCSDSSDATDTSDDEDFDSSTQCTSPGYTSLNPFKDSRPSLNPRRRIVRHGQGFSTIVETPTVHHNKKMVTVPWTTEMNNHLMSCFYKYCNDPTNTPFKHIPGCAPPLGVCHRVAALAKKMWRGGRSGSAGRHVTIESSVQPNPGESSVAAKVKTQFVVWPKSGASTRRRLRALCKRQRAMSPHYARLLQSRSPEPIDSNPFYGYGKPSNRAEAYQGSPFQTNALRFSVATSSAYTMQPNAPIANLTRDDGIVQPTPRVPRGGKTAVPWASPAAIPSDFEAGQSGGDSKMPEKPAASSQSRLESPDLPRLASPFNNQTWGPAATYSHQNPSTPVNSDQDITMTSPRLASAFQNVNTFPYPATGTQRRRRALGDLERAMSPEGSDGFSDPELPGWMQSASVCRARLRRYLPTVDRASIRDQGAPIFNPVQVSQDAPALSSIVDTTDPNEAGSTLRRLASPFAGINARPSRSRRTLSSGSNSIIAGFRSIEGMLSGTNGHNSSS